MLGKTISHFKILEKLGEGGMGVVYKAEDTRLKRTVALKFLPPELSRDEEAKKRFIREAQTASSLDHPNICSIHEIGETEDGQIFIVMAYYEGETLKQKLADGPLPVEQVVNIATWIAQGLVSAHDRGIVHRDIKPANIIITNKGEVKILDFGLAKLAGQAQLTKDASTLGTVAYMSPEQTLGENINHRTDIWSVGVVLYEMLTGELPFMGEYEAAILYAVVNEEAKPISNFRNDVPQNIEKVIKKCFEKNPDERYQSVNELLKDLKGNKTTGEKHHQFYTIKEDSKKSIGRKKWIIPFAIMLVLAAIIIFLINLLPKEYQPSDNLVAVIYFENETGDNTFNYLKQLTAQHLTENIGKMSVVDVVPLVSRCNLNIYFSQESRYKLA